MKHILLYTFAAALIATGCKKENPNNGNKPAPVKEQDSFPEWVTYTKANSQLPNDQINAIAIDNNDVKWIGTANGLLRIKGNEQATYNTANSALPSANIQALATEANGTVWIGTDAGVAKFNGNNWQVYHTGNSTLPNNGIKTIVHDSKYHNTWIGTEEGIIKINSQNKWDDIYMPHTILSMAVDQQGDLWLGVFQDFAFVGMIKKYHNGTWSTHRLDLLGYPSAFPYGIAVDKNNQVVVALAGTMVKAVIRFNGNNWQEITKTENARGLKTLVLQNDQIWVGGTTLSRFGAKSTPVISLPGTDSPILSMAIDSKGRKWLGTIYGGVAVYNSGVE